MAGLGGFLLPLAAGAAQGVNNQIEEQVKSQQKLDEINAARITAIAPKLMDSYEKKVNEYHDILAKKRMVMGTTDAKGTLYDEQAADNLVNMHKGLSASDLLKKAKEFNVNVGEPGYKSTLANDLQGDINNTANQTNAFLSGGAPRRQPTTILDKMFGTTPQQPQQGPRQPPAVRSVNLLDQQPPNPVAPVPTQVPGQAPSQPGMLAEGQPEQGINANAVHIRMGPNGQPQRIPTTLTPANTLESGKLKDIMDHPERYNSAEDAATAAVNATGGDYARILATLKPIRAWGQQVQQDKIAVAAASRPSIDVKVDASRTEGGTKAYDEMVKKHIEKLDEANTADQSLLSRLDAFKQLSAGLYTGLGAETVGFLGKLGQMVPGLENANLKTYTGRLEALQSITNSFIGDFRHDLPGNMSDPDRRFLVDRAPSINKTVLGNKLLIEYFEKAATRRIERYNAYISYVHEARDDTKERSRRIEDAPKFIGDWNKAHPTLTDDDRKKIDRINTWTTNMEPVTEDTTGKMLWKRRGKPSDPNSYVHAPTDVDQ